MQYTYMAVPTVQYVVRNALLYTGNICFSLFSGVKHALELEAREPLHTFIHTDEGGLIWQNVEGVEEIALYREQQLMSQANEEGILQCVQPSQDTASSTLSWSIQHTVQ